MSPRAETSPVTRYQPKPRLRPRAARVKPRATRRSRRAVVAVGILTAAALLFVWVKWTIERDTYSPHLREVRVVVPGLSHEMSVLQVADLGSDRFGPKQGMLESLISSRRFDAVVLTGDMLGGARDYDPIWELAEVAKRHSSRVWYLPGNHDTERVGEGLAARDVPTLPQDRSVALSDEDPDGLEAALVYGRSSETIASARERGRRLVVIASHTPPSETRLAAGAKLGKGVHLFIAGHTHGGQMRLPLLGAYRAPMSWAYEERAPAPGNEIVRFPDLRGRLVDGMYERGGQLVFVSHGLERTVFGYPRFLARAEIVAFRFVPSPQR